MGIGDFGSQLDSLEWMAGGAFHAIYEPDIARVPDTDKYVLVYGHVTPNFGEVSTVQIESDGSIGAALINTRQFEDTACSSPRIVNLGGSSFFAVAYGGSGGGFLKTFSVDTDGTISAMIATLEFETTACGGPEIIYLGGTKYAIVYRYSSGGDLFGRVVTVNINDDGTSLSVVDGPDNFATDGPKSQTGVSICRVGDTSTIYAIAYTENSTTDTTVKTIPISTAGVISSVVDTIAVNTYGTVPYIAYVTGEIHVVSFRVSGGGASLASIDIDTSGNIGSVKDTEVITTDNSTTDEGYLLKLAGSADVVLFATRSTDASQGNIYSLSVDSTTGVFTAVDDYRFENGDVYAKRLIQMSAGIYIILWGGETNTGRLETRGVTEGFVYPSEGATTRVSSLVHRFDRSKGKGIYILEMYLGEVVTGFGLPEYPSDFPDTGEWVCPYGDGLVFSSPAALWTHVQFVHLGGIPGGGVPGG